MNATRRQRWTRVCRLVSVGLLVCALLPGGTRASGWGLVAGGGLDSAAQPGDSMYGGAMTARHVEAPPAELPRGGGTTLSGAPPAPMLAGLLPVWGDGPTAGYADTSAVLMRSIRVHAYRRRSIAQRRL